MRRFGLIGYPLTHSFSEKYFAEKFDKEEITGCRYQLFPLKTITELPGLLKEYPGLEGLNVTIPYKQQVLSFLHERKMPEGLDACNCINITGGILTGYNTDVTAFEKSIKPLLKTYHTKALVLGTGGAAASVQFVLNKLKVPFLSVSRTRSKQDTISYDELNRQILEEYLLVINTTPLGTFPNVEEYPKIPYRYIGPRHLLYDVIYNPAKTIFLQNGEKNGAAIKNGEEMLVLQAEESWRIWNS